MTVNGSTHLGVKGAYRAQVVDSKTGEVVKDYGWHSNLILNSGLNLIGSGNGGSYGCIAGLMLYGAIGTGSRVNYITSSTSQITQSGNTLFLYDNSGLPDFTSSFAAYSLFTGSVQPGDVIVDFDNSQSTVTAVDSGGTMLTVDSNYTYTNGKNFIIWKTSQYSLDKEIKRSNSGLTGTDYVGTVDISSSFGARRMRKTYDFSIETDLKNYTEGGVHYTTSASASPKGEVFCRFLFPNPITIDVGYQMRLTYDLTLFFTPWGERYFNAPISGWPVAPATRTMGSESIQTIGYSYIDTNGGAQAETGLALEPGCYHGYNYYSSVFVSSNSDVLNAPGTSSTRTLNSDVAYAVPLTYVPGTYTRYKSGSFLATQINLTDIRLIGFGRYYSNGSRPWNAGYTDLLFRFDENQTKTNVQKMDVVYKITWNRILPPSGSF